MGHFSNINEEMGRNVGQDCGGVLKAFYDLLACHLHSFLSMSTRRQALILGSRARMWYIVLRSIG
jgi:hypothetical protein